MFGTDAPKIARFLVDNSTDRAVLKQHAAGGGEMDVKGLAHLIRRNL